MPQERVAVAMSGGVDSSMAAALLKESGYEVIGVTMQLWPRQATGEDRVGGCCGVEAVEWAKRVAYKLGILHYVINLRDIFAEKVIADFCREYSLGRTPNPCIRCNQYIKFDTLLQRAKELDADFLATGHYARIDHSPDGYRLLKAVDSSKDQSYFLYTLGQRELQHLLFPVGNLYKAEVRRLAAKMGLPTANRRDSQDICFIPDNDYRPFVARQVSLKPGDIVGTGGEVLGRHSGLAQYTVGQRQGLGLASGHGSGQASNKRLYVIKIDVAGNRLVVGTESQLLSNRLVARELSWVSGEAPTEEISATAKIRYKSPEVAAKLCFNDGVAEVEFCQSQRAVTPGQAVVFYQGDVVLGGGIIEDAETVLC